MADRGRVASLTHSNRICYERWVGHCQQGHRERLRAILPVIDTSAPDSLATLGKLDAKRQQAETLRAKQIDRENRMLLDKMARIMHARAQPLPSPAPFRSDLAPPAPPLSAYAPSGPSSAPSSTSLNRTRRVRELRRIEADNRSMLARIQASEAVYSHTKWEQEAKQEARYLDNLQRETRLRFKKPHNNSNNKHRTDRLPPIHNGAMSHRMADDGDEDDGGQDDDDDEEAEQNMAAAQLVGGQNDDAGMDADVPVARVLNEQ